MNSEHKLPILYRYMFLIIIYLLAFGVLALVFLVSRLHQVPFYKYTTDVQIVAGASRLSGIVSNLGIMIWSATAAIGFFCALTFMRETRREGLFFLAAGLLSALLMLDDMLLLHEYIAKYFGFPEMFSFIGYAVLLAAFSVYFRSTIMQTNFRILALFVFFSGLSIVFDLVPDYFPVVMPNDIFDFEESFKFLGIVSWFAYFSSAGILLIRSRLMPRPPTAEAA